MSPLRLTRSESEALAKRVSHFHQTVAKCVSKVTWKHFKEEGHPRKTIYTYISKYGDSENVEFKKNPGRTPTVLTPSKLKAIGKAFTNDPSLTVRAAAKRLKISDRSLSRGKVHKLGIKARVKKTVPKYTPSQETRAQEGCKKILRKLSGKVVIMDDETYVNLNPAETPQRKFFHSANPKDVEYDQKVKPKTKFPEKILIWQALDSDGNVSAPYFHRGTINGNIYKNECLKKRLIPFIHKHHDVDKILFWPDMATSHYCKEVTTYLKDQNVNFVLKQENAPNVPQCRPIERFWALCKKKYSSIRRQPKDLEAFKRKWREISKEVAEESGKALMAGVRQKVASVAKNGVRKVLGDKN